MQYELSVTSVSVLPEVHPEIKLSVAELPHSSYRIDKLQPEAPMHLHPTHYYILLFLYPVSNFVKLVFDSSYFPRLMGSQQISKILGALTVF
jgi:hypothetical protein